MTEEDLDKLKAAGDVPEWMDLGGYLTLSRGYLLDGETPRDMYRRCARAAALRLKRDDLEDKFFDILWKGWLGLASPVASNLGTDRGLPISCYSAYVDDSVDGIMGTTYEIAMLSKNGGGIGSYWGDVRPRGSEIKDNGKSDGVIPFLKILDSTTVGISQGGCYEEGVQVLTSEGFKDFRDLNPDDLIAQLDEDRNLSFALGEKTVRHWRGPMYRFSHPTSLDLGVTPNHRMMVERRKQKENKKYWPNKLEEISAEDSKFHRDVKLHAAAKRSQIGSLTPLERFRIAFQADGRKTNIRNNNEKFRVYFRIKKERKKERLREIFKDCNLLYTEKAREGVSSFSVEVSNEYFKPVFDWVDLTDFDSSRAAAFMLELSEWDSGKKKAESFRYSSTIKENVLVVEAMAAIGGFRTSYSVRKAHENKSDLHELFVQGMYRAISGEKITKSKFDYDGNVYCCIVPKGRIIVKDLSGNISVCGNTRRGASSAYLPIEHDDFDEFVDMRRPKGDPNRQCLNIHHGVCISDEFMEKVVSGDDEARRRWKKLIKARVETGEPYIFFSDTVDRNRPECYKDKGLDVKASNLCSEILLHIDNDHTFVCCLSSMNLSRWDEWKDTNAVKLAIYFLDGVMEEFIAKTENKKGFERARAFAVKSRALGLGAFGWHTLLQEKGMSFDELQSSILNNLIFKTMREQAEEATSELAEQYGEPEWCEGHGRRNTHLIAVAPTVTNSVICGGVSPGIEPLPSNAFTQKTAKGTFLRKNRVLEKVLEEKGLNTPAVWKTIINNDGSVQNLVGLSEEEKNIFKTARELNQFDLVRLAGQRQKHIDQGQSLNLFFPSNVDPKYLNRVHIEAWRQGVCTLYYMRTSSVLKGDSGSREYKREMSDCVGCEG